MASILLRSDIESALARRPHRPAAGGEGTRSAAVVLTLRPAGDDAEILLVRRAEHPRDPWSGHMGLPGGHRDPTDVDLVATARRETREEVGLTLERNSFIGRLDDIQPTSRHLPPIVISPFVAWMDDPQRVCTNSEVQYHRWAPISELLAPARQTTIEYGRNGHKQSLPAILYKGDTIWGLTHRIILNFIDLFPEGFHHV